MTQEIFHTKNEITKVINNELVNRVNQITRQQRNYIQKILLKLSMDNPINATLICDYILFEETSINIKESTKESKIKNLVWLSNYFDSKKSFLELTRNEILEYLNSSRKSIDEDPDSKWINTYNGRQLIFSSFFRWLYNQDEYDKEKIVTPECIKGIKRLHNKNKSAYKPSDMWEEREHLIFLKYCPNIRDRCYHAMAIDTSARPSELLNLKIKDIVFKKIEESGKQYAEIEIRNGKTGSRTLPLIDSIPYVKEWIIHGHPNGTNPDAWFFVALSNNDYGKKLTRDGLYNHYVDYYKNTYFPKLLDNNKITNTIPDYDKSIIKNLLTKPWNLYVFRHSALTEKSKILKESTLRDHAGWTASSKMPQTYIHYFGKESSRSLLEAKGIVKKINDNNEKPDILKPRQCPNCLEPNKPDSKFCSSCKMVLEYNSYKETLEDQKKSTERLKELEIRVNSLTIGQQEILTLLKNPDRLSKILQST